MTVNPVDALQTLTNSLPADPDDHAPIAVPSDAIRSVLTERWRRPSCMTLYELQAEYDDIQQNGAEFLARRLQELGDAIEERHTIERAMEAE